MSQIDVCLCELLRVAWTSQHRDYFKMKFFLVKVPTWFRENTPIWITFLAESSMPGAPVSPSQMTKLWHSIACEFDAIFLSYKIMQISCQFYGPWPHFDGWIHFRHDKMVCMWIRTVLCLVMSTLLLIDCYMKHGNLDCACKLPLDLTIFFNCSYSQPGDTYSHYKDIFKKVKWRINYFNHNACLQQLLS